jgi:enterochelin esterase family protein
MTTPHRLSLLALSLALAVAPAVFAAEAAATPPAETAKKKAPAAPQPLAAVASPARTTDNVEFVIGPDYKWAPEVDRREGVPRGAVHEFMMKSEDSKLYPGIAKDKPGVVPYKRAVVFYLPPGYVAGQPVPLIVAQDGVRAYSKFLPTILDNLIADKRVPALAAVMIDSGGGDSKGSQRGLEYDTVSGVYADFIETEVLPYIAKTYNVTFTKDPAARATMGGSSGGSAAFTMAWFRPDLYHRVLTYSGTYVDQQFPTNPQYLHGAWEYHEHLIPQSERKPLRIWLHVSENDNGSNRPESTLHNWVLANQRMAAALKAKGYPYRYVYAEAAGHTDGRVTRQTLPEALVWLWADYKGK